MVTCQNSILPEIYIFALSIGAIETVISLYVELSVTRRLFFKLFEDFREED
jgi:hypothetical protein